MSNYAWAPGYHDDGDRPQIVTSRFKYDDGYSLERYLATGGYSGLRAALSRTPTEVHDEVRAANVLGRGGGGGPPPPPRASRAPTRTASSWSATRTS